MIIQHNATSMKSLALTSKTNALANAKAITAKLSANASFAQNFKGLQVQIASENSDAENQSVDLTQNTQEEQSNADNTPVEAAEWQSEKSDKQLQIKLPDSFRSQVVVYHSDTQSTQQIGNQGVQDVLAILDDTYEGKANISWGDNYNSPSTDLMEDNNIDSGFNSGDTQNSERNTLNNLIVMQEEVIYTEPTIKSTDVAVEMTQATINNVMVQNAQINNVRFQNAKKMIEQANQQSPGILQLLQ